MTYRHVDFTDNDRARIVGMREAGDSYLTIARRFSVSADTIIAVVNGTWSPRKLKLPLDGATVYFDWLALGSYAAVARKYGTTDKPVRQKISRFRRRMGLDT